MLRQLRMQNYRCFDDHTILLEPRAVLVGRNNAGKSSIIEAFRILATVVNRDGASFVPAPHWTNLSRFQVGIAPGISALGLNLNAVFHRYQGPPAMITASFTEGAAITIYVGKEEKVFAAIESKGDWVKTSAKFFSLNLPWISVLPQIGPLLTEEYQISDERVLDHLNTRLASRHFRNQLYRMAAEFGGFKRLAEETWHGLRVDPIQRGTPSKDGTLLTLSIRDGDFVSEVGWMGHGLQMWLQTIWFLSRTPINHTVILHEPDVYMHPDLQRKLFRLASSRFSQCIIATHSVEIMAETEPANILIIDKRNKRSRYANSEPGVQSLIDQIGGIHNVHLARLWSARRFLLVEGKDISFLKRWHSVLFPDAELPLDAIPSLPIGGWNGWPYAVGSSMTLRNAVGDRIMTYCILDSDYHTDAEIEQRYKEATERGVSLHIWSGKEIENFLLQANPVRRVLAARAKDHQTLTEAQIHHKLLELCEGERRSVEDGMAAAIIQANRRLDLKTANKMARSRVDAIWKEENLRPMVVPGKDVLARLAEWAKDSFGFSLGPPALARHMTVADIPNEVAAVIGAIEAGDPFPNFQERRERWPIAA
jgi:hypothetical protein